jgi:hypothetical protein
MSISYSSFNQFAEPNWLWVQNHSYLDFNYRTNEFCAFMCRYAYKAQDNDDCNMDDELYDAYEAGYLLDGMTEEDYEDYNDPCKYMSPVSVGPYFIDQDESGQFTFQGPRLQLQGPKADFWFKPPGCTDEYWYDRSLYSDEECQPSHR